MTLAVPDPETNEIAQARLDDDDWRSYRSLTDLQRAFVMEYVKDMNGARAAERAGYSGSIRACAVRGSMLMKHPKVNPLIRKLTAATADEMGLTREWLTQKLEEVATRIMEGTPRVYVTDDGQAVVVKDEDGNPIMDQEWSPQVAISALKTLAQLRGDLIERQEIDVRSVHVVINGSDVEALR